MNYIECKYCNFCFWFENPTSDNATVKINKTNIYPKNEDSDADVKSRFEEHTVQCKVEYQRRLHNNAVIITKAYTGNKSECCRGRASARCCTIL
jgi:hypothetical protein